MSLFSISYLLFLVIFICVFQFPHTDISYMVIIADLLISNNILCLLSILQEIGPWIPVQFRNSDRFNGSRIPDSQFKNSEMQTVFWTNNPPVFKEKIENVGDLFPKKKFPKGHPRYFHFPLFNRWVIY